MSDLRDRNTLAKLIFCGDNWQHHDGDRLWTDTSEPRKEYAYRIADRLLPLINEQITEARQSGWDDAHEAEANNA